MYGLRYNTYGYGRTVKYLELYPHFGKHRLTYVSKVLLVPQYLLYVLIPCMLKRISEFLTSLIGEHLAVLLRTDLYRFLRRL